MLNGQFAIKLTFLALKIIFEISKKNVEEYLKSIYVIARIKWRYSFRVFLV
jgi:hypothetical protein